MAGDPWPAVKAEHLSNVGFVEGPGNANPWTDEVFGYHAPAAYCISAATVVPFHHGVEWPEDAQNSPRGFAYCPYAVTWAQRHGYWEPDAGSRGQFAMAHEGDLYLWDWNFDGVADHCETAMADDDGTDGWRRNILGYNCKKPRTNIEGCWNDIIRPNKYLLGVIHMCEFAYSGAAVNPGIPITPTPRLPEDDMKYLVSSPDYRKGAVYLTDRMERKWISSLDELGRVQGSMRQAGWPDFVRPWVPSEIHHIPIVGPECPVSDPLDQSDPDWAPKVFATH